MREISDHMLDFVKGGMNLNGLPSSTNVIDLRGKDMGTYIDANGACWAPGTPLDLPLYFQTPVIT